MKKITLLLLLITITAQAQIPFEYYDYANGATGYDLKTRLKRIIDNNTDNAQISTTQYLHNPQSYGALWTLYPNSDDRVDGKVWDMYSNCDFTFGTVASGGNQDNGTGGNTECVLYNREHSFPRSWFGGSTSLPIYSDPFHVIPTDKKVNADRGNLAYGEVNTSLSHTTPGNALKGTSSITGPTGSVFEPHNDYKGDIARGYFYIATRYESEIAAWEANDTDGDSMLDGSSNKVFEQWALDMLYSWHIADPVSQKEIDRNESIYAHQNNRNPFIDHPEWVNEIWGSVLAVEDYVASDFNIHPNPTYSNTVYINKGNNNIKLLELYSISGKLILTKKIDTQYSVITLDHLDRVASGMYLLKIHTDKNSVVKKLVIN